MNFWNQFWWVIFPYLMLAIFVIGHIYRYNTDQLGWTAKSSEIMEKNTLKWGSILFHVGILMVLGGHLVGLLIPKAWTEAVGISEEMYHASAIFGGGIAGLITFTGILILLFRRVNVKRVRMTSSFSDMLVVILLFIEIVMGMYNTLGYNLFVGGFDYRETLAPWLRGLLVFRPDPTLMIDVPLFFKLHTLFAFAIFGIWPFTRLVHVWSFPLEYLKRSMILYRSRNAQRVMQIRQLQQK
ncbi:respiratory nitrate reductase subunit gamma [Tepidibacillus fermentans]|uniref:Nitrate reductase gamma subunit n=1 Tax=Tepidibacillus fermentans TaxID=1281767 RepID=A0A4V2UT77_9BACI|nr:respiratory nitrate reductase subunit gamma [Tepidibacillus fermentans]TCS84559.1 nitrate reductase gamma subunit [Tepidibacillus fermentans]